MELSKEKKISLKAKISIKNLLQEGTMLEAGIVSKSNSKLLLSVKRHCCFCDWATMQQLAFRGHTEWKRTVLHTRLSLSQARFSDQQKEQQILISHLIFILGHMLKKFLCLLGRICIQEFQKAKSTYNSYCYPSKSFCSMFLKKYRIKLL